MGVAYTFEWDPHKARENQRKHGIAFEHAAYVLQDPLALSIYDASHSAGEEDRWITMGKVGAELLVVVHTFKELGPEGVLVRIISARKASKPERRQYEEAK